MPQDEWRVVIPEHHPGYISWDQFLANRHRLAANRRNCEVLAGPAREGLCLLQGLLVCGICGRRLGVRYTGNGGLYPIYQCNWKHREALSPQACMNVAAKPLDAAVAERLVTAVTPVTIELGLETLTSALRRSRRRRPKLGHRGFADRELQARRDRSVQLPCRRCLPSRQSLAEQPSRRTSPLELGCRMGSLALWLASMAWP
jgi:hypothetical protein